MNFVTVEDVIEMHAAVIAESGGGEGVLDLGRIESAVAQPQLTFGGEDLYPSVAAKVAALGYSLALNHGFVDGNKRIAHLAIEMFLALNGWELVDDVDEQEAVILQLAAGTLTRIEFTTWIAKHIRASETLP